MRITLKNLNELPVGTKIIAKAYCSSIFKKLSGDLFLTCCENPNPYSKSFGNYFTDGEVTIHSSLIQSFELI